jgi:hypothetical protein
MIYPSIHVCYNSGDVIYCVSVVLADSERRVIVECVGPLGQRHKVKFMSRCSTARHVTQESKRQSQRGGRRTCGAVALSHILFHLCPERTLMCGTKTKTDRDTGAGTTATHTGHDDQSETDTQSQFSDEANTTPQVVSRKTKAPVCAA